ncbi:hypothetical protein ACHWQZ_G001524 [Mnemiopsis leidyi]
MSVHEPVRTTNFATSVLSLMVLGNVVNCLCTLKELTDRTNSVITGFGPPGKFRAEGNGGLFIYSLAGGEVELRDGGKYRCNRLDRWDTISVQQGVYYKLYKVPVRPEHAGEVCAEIEKGGALATVYNTRINGVMAAVMSGGGVDVALIGITDTEEEGTWVWSAGFTAPEENIDRTVSGKEDAIPGVEDVFPDDLNRYNGFTNWYTGQPNNWGPGEDYCVMTSFRGAYGKWYDIGPPNPSSPLVLDPVTKKPVYPLRVPFWCQLEMGAGFEGSIRLAEGESEGVLLVETERDEWSAVCSEQFTALAAEVACRTLGYVFGEHRQSFISNSLTDYSIDINAVECEGQEKSLLECKLTHSTSTCDNAVWLQCYRDCPAGFYSDQACLPCPAGKYSEEKGSEECGICKVGYYQDQVGQSSCKECPVGYTTRFSGSQSQQDCNVQIFGTENCGVNGLDGSVSRIVGGTGAEEREYPWHVIINIGGAAACGGTLIDSDTVITAAHCLHKVPNRYRPICHSASNLGDLSRVLQEDKIALKPGVKLWSDTVPCDWLDKESLTVWAGVTDRSRDAPQRRRVDKVYVSPRYVYILSTAQHNDIAVLKLSFPYQFYSAVSPVCLPAPNSTPQPGTLMTITGFGVTQFGVFTMSQRLMKANVPLVDSDICNTFMRGGISSQMICAGYRAGGVDSCQGDSGGPLLDNQTGRHTLVGVVSWGVGCASRDRYGVYTEVGKFLEFVESARRGDVHPVIS